MAFCRGVVIIFISISIGAPGRPIRFCALPGSIHYFRVRELDETDDDGDEIDNEKAVFQQLRNGAVNIDTHQILIDQQEFIDHEIVDHEGKVQEHAVIEHIGPGLEFTDLDGDDEIQDAGQDQKHGDRIGPQVQSDDGIKDGEVKAEYLDHDSAHGFSPSIPCVVCSPLYHRHSSIECFPERASP